jgi:hypothetical protein
MVFAALAAAMAVSFAAEAQRRGSASATATGPSRPSFSLATGETMARGVGEAYARFGWPSADFGYQYGLNEKVDVGALFGLLYGYEATTTTQFGLLFAAPIRSTVLRRDKISVLLSITPGFQIYTTSPAIGSVNFPIGAVLGVQVAPDLRVGIGADAVMKVLFGGGSSTFEFAPMFGPAIEYYVDRQLLISLETRFGPVIFTAGGSNFGFRTQVGVAYRM